MLLLLAVTNHRNGVPGDMIKWNLECAMSSFGAGAFVGRFVSSLRTAHWGIIGQSFRQSLAGDINLF